MHSVSLPDGAGRAEQPLRRQPRPRAATRPFAVVDARSAHDEELTELLDDLSVLVELGLVGPVVLDGEVRYGLADPDAPCESEA